MNYRAFYQQVTKRTVPTGWQIHHIDFNRENNNIENLVALPKKVHRQYHKAIDNCRSFFNPFQPIQFDFTLSYENVNNGFYRMNISALQKLSQSMTHIFPYLEYKKNLLETPAEIINHLY